MIRITILAEMAAARENLARMLREDPEIEIVALGASPQDFTRGTQQADVQVVLAPEVYASPIGTSVLPEADPGQGVLWLSDDPALAVWLARNRIGAWGLLPAEASAEEMQAAVRALNEGLVVGMPALMESLLDREPPVEELRDEEQSPQITGREGEVLQLLSQGLANKQIADVLGISPHTVKYHISSIYSRLGATNRAEAVRLAIQAGLISL
ncbi:MAG: response regulator transcription factor [Chloroflexi bacterium]|nr:response regulator transcription factor [Chloroflexota bacterium]